jgi:hypothetical protein
MILVYVCPKCRAVRIASRRKEVSCIACDSIMRLSDLEFIEWSNMSREKREAYGVEWLEREKERIKK